MKHSKTTASLMELFASQCYGASFEQLGQNRTLGEVYDDLMTADELNQYIDGQGMSNAVVYTNNGKADQTTHKINSPYVLSDIINTSGFDVFNSGSNSYSSRLSYAIIIKGDVSKYSYAYTNEYADSKGYNRTIRVYNHGLNSLNDGSTTMSYRPVNISIKDGVKVPGPIVVLLMTLGLGFMYSYFKYNVN